MQNRPKALQERVFKKLFKVAAIAGFTEEERTEYEESLKTYRDIKNVVDTAHAEGKLEGKIEEKEGVIARCVEENMSLDTISKIVNLPVSEVKKLIEKIKKNKE